SLSCLVWEPAMISSSHSGHRAGLTMCGTTPPIYRAIPHTNQLSPSRHMETRLDNLLQPRTGRTILSEFQPSNHLETHYSLFCTSRTPLPVRGASPILDQKGSAWNTSACAVRIRYD